jgi:hypothetical protein
VSITPRLALKLQEALGADATEDLVTWISQSDSLRGDVAELRHELQLGFARLDARMDRMDARMDARFDQLRTEMTALVEKRTADLMKWSFVFWVGAVGAIAVLAGVLR